MYDGQGFWLCHKRLSQGRFPWWPAAAATAVPATGRPSTGGPACGRQPDPNGHPPGLATAGAVGLIFPKLHLPQHGSPAPIRAAGDRLKAAGDPAGLRQAAGEPRGAGWQDAQHTGDHRSGQPPPGRSPGPRRASARPGGRRADSRGLRVVRATWPTWWRTRTPRSAGCASCSSEARTEKTAALVGDKDPTAAATSPSDSPADPTANAAAPSAANAVEAAPAARGHGRNGADAYHGAERIDVPHAIAQRRRRLSRLWGRPCLRQGPGRGGADHRAAAADGAGSTSCKNSVATCAARSLPRSCRPRRATASTTPRLAA